MLAGQSTEMVSRLFRDEDHSLFSEPHLEDHVVRRDHTAFFYLYGLVS